MLKIANVIPDGESSPRSFNNGATSEAAVMMATVDDP